MTTVNQLALIRELLGELEWDTNDLADYIGEEFQNYERLPYEQASELISCLTEYKRERTRERKRDGRR